MKVCRICKKKKRTNHFDEYKCTVKGHNYSYRRNACKVCLRIERRIAGKKSYKSVARKPNIVPGEQWIAVQEFEKYLVSNLGRVKREEKQILKAEKTKRGYLRVLLSVNGIVTRKSVHRLVAIAFIPNPEDKPQVNHKDGNPENNKITNLEWVTQSENQFHAVRTGLQKSKKRP